MVDLITRWDKWFSEHNLRKDERILMAPPSTSAKDAAAAFKSRGKQVILDLACGVGRDTFYLEDCGFTMIGVDASINGLRVAQRIKSQRGSSCELVTADARRLPFSDRALEGVYCFGLLHEFTGEHSVQSVRDVMVEIKRVLADDSSLVLTVLAGEPEAGLPAVQLFTREMFADATQGLRPVEMKVADDTGCTGRTDYLIWYGSFEKPADASEPRAP
jgi:ubiquinone/menaquinone biosynthesis C-methylase UbiE